MSKFVTYPAVTVLDNDHSLLIDDPNAGTNSITAENAGNTLLSKWAGFETFDEAVQNTISNNQEFIDRDAAIREETAELKKKIVTTFPAKEASGAVATFESEFEDAPLKSCIVRVEPVQDLHGYDYPWPAGGGKNKFPGASELGGSTSIYGLTWIPQEDGGMKISGTVTIASWLYRDRYIDFENFYGFSIGDTIAVSGKDTAGNYMTAIHFYNGSTLLVSVKNGNSAVIPEGTTRVRLLFYAKGSAPGVIGETIDNTVYMQIEEGSTATSYAPYENICPITGWTGCEVQRTGKNLLNLVESEMVSSGWDRIFPISLKAGTYFISCQNQFGASTKGAAVALVDDNYATVIKWLSVYEFGDSTLVGRVTIITEEEASKIKNLRFALRAGGATYNDIVQGNIQLELGSTATEYEPYTGRIYPISFPSEAGTVYGGYIDPINGEMVVDRAMVDLGTLDWKYYASGKYFYATLPDRFLNRESDTGIGMCDRYKYFGNYGSNYLKDNMPDKNFGFTSASSTTYIFVKDSDYTTKEAFIEAVSGAQLVYTLNSEYYTHIPITSTEIKTLLGTNNIWADTGDVSVEYLMSDVSWYVEKKLRAFQSILAGVEDSSTASKNYSANTYLVFNDDIYRVTKAITAGETIEEGVNVTKTTVAEQLLALAQA